jgi:hypothetical protein
MASLELKSFLVTALMFASAAGAANAAGPYYQPDAIVLNLTESDLNRVLREAVFSATGPALQGEQPEVSDGVQDLRYYAEFSDPRIRLGEGGHASIAFDIREASLLVGSAERKVAWTHVRCENFGVAIDPERPLYVELQVRFAANEQGLQIIPQSLEVPSGKQDWRLIKPSRCRSGLLPKWLLWAIGKPYLRRQIRSLDETLLERARESAQSLNNDGFLREELEIESLTDGQHHERVYLYPNRLETGGGSLLLSLAGSTIEPAKGTRRDEGWAEPPSESSFFAVSESLLNRLLESAFAGTPPDARPPSGDFARLFESRSVFTLVPGLRERPTIENVRYTLRYGAPPRIEFSHAAPGVSGDRRGSAVVTLHLAGIELMLWGADENGDVELGTLRIDTGRLSVIPVPSPMGGLSFEVVENEWRVSSRGVRFNESILAATLQELAFAEVFETTYDPILRGDLQVAETIFEPAAIRLVGDHLLVELTSDGSGAGVSNVHANK